MDKKFKAIAYFFALAFSRMKRVQIMLANLTFKLIPFRHLYRATMYPGPWVKIAQPPPVILK